MAQYVDTHTKSFQATTALAANRRVKLSSGKLVYAGASDVELGTTEHAALAADEWISVRLRTAPGTALCVASEAITAGNPGYAAANGKVAATGTVYVGTVLQAPSGDGSEFELLRGPNTDITAAITGTTAAAFEVDSDATTPKIALSGQSGGTGDYTTTLKPETTLSGDNAIIVPEADGDTLVAVALAQTLTSKTLTSPVLNALPKFQNTVTPVAAAGTTVADAGQLASTMINHITSDGATKGVKFPTGAQNHLMIVINNSSTAAELYAASGGTVNGLSADASVVIPASKGVLAFATGADTWIVFDLPAKATAS